MSRKLWEFTQPKSPNLPSVPLGNRSGNWTTPTQIHRCHNIFCPCRLKYPVLCPAVFNQNSAGSILQGKCPKSWRFKTNRCRKKEKKKKEKKPPKEKKNKTLRNPSGSYQDGTGTRHQCLQDTCITLQTESEHVVCIRMQTTFFPPPPGLVHTVAQTWLSYWPHADMAEAIHRKDPLATHFIYMPCFRRFRFENSNLQRQGCL